MITYLTSSTVTKCDTAVIIPRTAALSSLITELFNLPSPSATTVLRCDGMPEQSQTTSFQILRCDGMRPIGDFVKVILI